MGSGLDAYVVSDLGVFEKLREGIAIVDWRALQLWMPGPRSQNLHQTYVSVLPRDMLRHEQVHAVHTLRTCRWPGMHMRLWDTPF